MNHPELSELLIHMAQENIAVLSLVPGTPPTFTHIGVVFQAKPWRTILSKRDCQEMIFSVLFEEQRASLSTQDSLSSDFAVVGHGKWRINVRRDGPDNISATIELIENRHHSQHTGRKTPLTEPVVFAALDPATLKDKGLLSDALTLIAKADATLQIKTDPKTGQFILFGMGEQQLRAVHDRLKREFQIAVGMRVPRVAYKETVHEAVTEEASFTRSWNYGAQYGHAFISIDPLPAGHGFVYRNELAKGRLPETCMAAIEAGVRDAVETGALAGYPLTDLLVTLIDGPYRYSDFDETAFRIAGAMALRRGCKNASPVILEPVMTCEVAAPERYIDVIIGDLNQRRARIERMDDLGSSKRIICTISISELFGYTDFLRSATQNTASYISKPRHYEEISFERWKASNDPHSPDEPPTASAGRPVLPTRPKPGIPGGARKPFPPEPE